MHAICINQDSWWIIGKSIGFIIYAVIDIILAVPTKRHIIRHKQTLSMMTRTGTISLIYFHH